MSEITDYDAYIDSLRQHRYHLDSTKVTLRSVDPDEIESYLSDPDYDYSGSVQPATNLIDRFLMWLYSVFDDMFGNRVVGEILPYALILLAIVLVAYALTRGENSRRLFRAAAKSKGLEYEEAIEDISTLNFDQLIAEAVAAKEYRRAIRFQYLKVLRALTDRGMIEWRQEKTNSDYLRELEREDLRPEFRRINWLFDYVWYGGFDVSQQEYRQMEGSFARFSAMIAGERRS